MILLATLLTGCSSKPVVVEEIPEPRVLVKDRYVEIPERLTRRQPEVERPAELIDTFELGALFKVARTRLQVCNGQLAEISRVAGTEVTQ